MSRGAVTVHSRETAFDDFLRIERAEVSYPRPDGGRVERQKIVVLERGDSAAALLHDVERDLVILVEQFRFATYEKGPGWLLETAAGGVGAGETPEQSMVREIEEELGYAAPRLRPIAGFYASPGGSSERIFLFYGAVTPAALRNPAASGRADEREAIRRVEIPPNELFRRLDAGALQDAKLIIAAQWLRRELRLIRRRRPPPKRVGR